MPWITIAIWLITYLLSSKQEGVSKGEAALLATGAAGLAYYAVDPANPDNLAGFKYPDSWGIETGGGGVGGGLSGLPSWVLPAAGGAIVGGTLSGSLTKILPWLVGGLAAFLLLRRKGSDTVVRVQQPQPLPAR